jgi:hypothetical protein
MEQFLCINDGYSYIFEKDILKEDIDFFCDVLSAGDIKQKVICLSDRDYLLCLI